MSQQTIIVGESLRLQALAANADFVLTVPPGWAINRIYMIETAGHAITGGIRIGTTNGAADVVVAQTVGASNSKFVTDATTLLRRWEAAQDLFVQAVTSWNSAVIDFYITLERVPIHVS